MHKSYTAVVVGLGVVGSATLWRLAQQQQDVLGLEAGAPINLQEVPMVARGYFARRTGKVRITYHFWRKRIWAGESCKRLATGHCCITAGAFHRAHSLWSCFRQCGIREGWRYCSSTTDRC